MNEHDPNRPRTSPSGEPVGPRGDDAQAKKDAAAFAGGCLAGLGTVGLMVTTALLALLAVVAIGIFLIFLACSR